MAKGNIRRHIRLTVTGDNANSLSAKLVLGAVETMQRGMKIADIPAAMERFMGEIKADAKASKSAVAPSVRPPTAAAISPAIS